MISPPTEQRIETWPIERLVEYPRNPRKNDAAVDRMCASIREFGFKIPCLVRSDGEVVDGHLRLKAARKLGITEIPVILCDEWTPAQVKAFRLMVNRSVTWADWDEELLALELQEIQEADLRSEPHRIRSRRDRRTARARRRGEGQRGAAAAGVARVPAGRSVAARAAPRALRRRHERGSCRAAARRAQAAADGDRSAVRYRAGFRVARSRWAERLRAGRAELHEEADGGPHRNHDLRRHARRLVGSIRAGAEPRGRVRLARVASSRAKCSTDCCGSAFCITSRSSGTKARTVLTRTLYWFQHEPCWFVRKKNAPWFGKAGENSTIWDSPSPKFIMGGSDEEKYRSPDAKARRADAAPDPEPPAARRAGLRPVPRQRNDARGRGIERARLLRHRARSEVRRRRGAALADADGKKATLDGDGRTFEEIKAERARRPCMKMEHCECPTTEDEKRRRG